MKMILTHISALEFWRSPLGDAGPARERCRMSDLPETVPASSCAKDHPLVRNRILSTPIHVLALDGRRRNTSGFVVHQTQSLPAGSLRSIVLPDNDEVLLVTCPELTVIHVARLLGFSRTVHLGYEFCGTYAPDDIKPYGVRTRAPLTSPAKLNSYLVNAKHVCGARKVQAALPHVLSGSASPRESALGALVTLPYLRGGSNIAHPHMNAEVPLGKQGGWTSNRSFFRCDLLWPEERVAVEYDSTLCHTGATRIAEDASRRNALESLGLTVVTATWRQVANYQEYNRFARILAGHLGARIRPTCRAYPSKQFALRAELLR